MKSSSRDELEGFAARMLGPVVDHDRRTGGELIATLRAYVEEGFVQRRAAERLVVHVNTVVYRLRRISELLGVDLADPAVTFDLSLALRILDVQEGR
jgi:DNA-binding PucR family transcriptional regulator